SKEACPPAPWRSRRHRGAPLSPRRVPPCSERWSAPTPPPRKTWKPNRPYSSSVLEQASGNDHPLNLAGALIDLGDPSVPHMALGVEFFAVPLTAVDLQSLVRHSAGHLRSVQFGHRALERMPNPAVFEQRRLQHQQPRGVDFGGHVRDHELDRLVL